MKLIAALTEQAVVLEQRTCCRCGLPLMTLTANVCPACKAPNLTYAESKRKSVGLGLTPRQKQVANLITAKGLLNKEIAYELGLTEGTVKGYLVTMFARLQVRNRTELALRWKSMNSSSS